MKLIDELILPIIRLPIYSNLFTYCAVGREGHFRFKRKDPDAIIKEFSGLGEAGQGFVKIKPNKVLVDKNSKSLGNYV